MDKLSWHKENRNKKQFGDRAGLMELFYILNQNLYQYLYETACELERGKHTEEPEPEYSVLGILPLLATLKRKTLRWK